MNNKELDECIHFDGMICMEKQSNYYGSDCPGVDCEYKTVGW